MPTYTFKLTNSPEWVIRSDGLLCRVDLLLAQEYLAGGGTFLPMAAEDYAAEKAAVLTQACELRDKIFARLNGIQLDYTIAGNNPTGVAAIATAKVGLKGITTHATVVAAVTGAEATAALKARYAVLVAALYVADQYACTAFNGMDV